jgi:hypothetical protein
MIEFHSDNATDKQKQVFDVCNGDLKNAKQLLLTFHLFIICKIVFSYFFELIINFAILDTHFCLQRQSLLLLYYLFCSWITFHKDVVIVVIIFHIFQNSQDITKILQMISKLRT